MVRGRGKEVKWKGGEGRGRTTGEEGDLEGFERAAVGGEDVEGVVDVRWRPENKRTR